MPHKNSFTWNMIISGFVKGSKLNVARKFFDEMPTKNGVAWNLMIHGYAENGHSLEALRLFKDLKSGCYGPCHVDMYVLATVFGACTDLLALVNASWEMFHLQLWHVIILCSSLGDSILSYGLLALQLGKTIHACIVVSGVKFDPVLGSSILFLLPLWTSIANVGLIDDGRKLFDDMIQSDEASWNSMLMGYVTNGYGIEALH
ncbi:Pentatricopeptide repeat-containing protein [Cynara cardunculus var. scolymus]|uniref:Pentatricopeptide repeat-containing protein n=1 Tax=Cynara cardunculus var. scolymus TaxID=59895 RepID=A0A103XB70_CYNCS|nr:Pentatricopeptide repeat-containing protein [Cynara cardunculus var. scolymus]